MLLLYLKIVSPEDNYSIYLSDILKLFLESVVSAVTSSSSMSPIYPSISLTLIPSYQKTYLCQNIIKGVTLNFKMFPLIAEFTLYPYLSSFGLGQKTEITLDIFIRKGNNKEH